MPQTTSSACSSLQSSPLSSSLSLSSTSLTQVKRGPKRALDDHAALLALIDQSLLCHVGFQVNGQVRVIPTCHWREGDYLYWHGHSKAANIAGADQGSQKVCITLSHLAGLVMARSAFHQSGNYRAAMIYGVPEAVTDPIEKKRHFELFVEKLSPGRWEKLRPVTDVETQATGIMRIKLNEASMKVRAEGVNDDEADMNWPVWAGVLPIKQQWGQPEQDKQQHHLSAEDMPLPCYPGSDIKPV